MDIGIVASVIVNAAIVIGTLQAWFSLLFAKGTTDAPLADKGIWSLRYFTVISNLISCVVSAAFVAAYVTGGPALPDWLLALKLVAATGVMLTCVVVITLLVPTYGLKSMYVGGNFWMHLVLPLLAALDCCVLVPVGSLPWQTSLWAIVPVALYGIKYLHDIFRHGAEENGIVYDFYHFLRWGKDKIAVVFVAAAVSTWIIALVLHAASRLLCG